MRTYGTPSPSIGHNRGPVWLRTSWVPEDAVAVIRRPTRSVMTSGTRRTRRWTLGFERRAAPFIEPLMGWTAGDDPMTQVELSFPTLDGAVGFADRQGLTYRVEGPGIHGPGLSASAAKPRRRSRGTPVPDRIPAPRTP
jgi:hypothetical protein